MLDAALASFLDLHRAGRFGEAEAGYRKAAEEGTPGAGFLLATLLLQNGRNEEAATLLESLVAAEPDNADLAVNLSIAWRHLGRLEDSTRIAREACRYAPDKVAAWNAMGLAAFDAGQFEEALAAFESGLGLMPDHPALRLHHAHSLRRLRRDKEALASYARLLRSNPRVLAAWRCMGDVQVAMGLAEAALDSRRQAVALAPKDPDVALEYAATLLAIGKVDEAAGRFKALIQAEPEKVHAWIWFGRAMVKLGQKAVARDAFTQALVLEPNHPVARHLLAAATGTVSTQVSEGYVRQLFDDFAGRFEFTLIGNLQYAGPGQLVDFLQRHSADSAASMLDLGCGTGLVAEKFVRSGRSIDGVDLSPRMLEHARAKGLYRSLHESEIVSFLKASSQRWELIVAADVFIYLPDLKAIHAAAFDRLEPGGHYAFSIEKSVGDHTELIAETARYRHWPEQIAHELAEAGFVDVVSETVDLRFELNEPVACELFLARRPA